MVWDLATSQRITTLKAHSDSVNAVSFSGEGSILASVGVVAVLVPVRFAVSARLLCQRVGSLRCLALPLFFWL